MPIWSDVNWAAVTAALPALGAVAKGAAPFADRGLEHRARRHAEILNQMPEKADTSPLLRVLNAELAEIADRGERRLHRKLDWTTVFTIVVVVGLSTGLILGLWRWADAVDIHAVSLLLRVTAWAVGLLGFLLVAVGGLPQLWKDRREEGRSTKAATSSA